MLTEIQTFENAQTSMQQRLFFYQISIQIESEMFQTASFISLMYKLHFSSVLKIENAILLLRTLEN